MRNNAIGSFLSSEEQSHPRAPYGKGATGGDGKRKSYQRQYADIDRAFDSSSWLSARR
jgi:hypothetical protein